MRVEASPSRRKFRSSAVLNLTICCLLAVRRSVDLKAAAAAAAGQPIPSTGRRDNPVDGLDQVGNDKEWHFEDLPEGFHNDVDSITVAVGGHLSLIHI